ncbi:MAG: MATE family efflux transporter [Lachnospiraceae bacterium]|nr:MATE family efflux transporter [Lachnospiraceae bacterium]
MEQRQENKMGVMPVKKLIITMSIPMMISMLVQALYNIVDSIFVARLSEDALTAVTLAFPLQNLMIAVTSGTGVGVNALLSKSLGEKRFDRSDKTANTAIFLSFCNFAAFALIGLFLAKAFIHSQTQDAIVAEYGITYLRIVMGMSLGLSYQIMLERLLQSTGRTVYSMASQLSGAIINIILDPIMIFGYFGCPAFGVAGAAYATVTGQTVAALIGLVLNLKYNQDIRIRMDYILKPEGQIVWQIYRVGVPSILMMSIGSVMTYMMNRILIAFSNTATAVFGVYFKLQSFFFMPIFGLNNGLIPVLAYNYGARRRDRIDEALKFSAALALGIMLTGTLIFQLFPGALLDLFNAHEEMKAIGIPALRIISLHFPIAAVCIVMGSIFQAFSRSIYSLIVSVARQLVALIPAAWLLARTGVVTNVWFAFPIAEIMSLIISVICFRKLYREVVAVM